MQDELVGTKLALVVSAGELFAEFGLDGASIRAIADKAGANSAAISYYFGSKENLYTETLRYVITKEKTPKAGDYLDSDPRVETPEGIAEIIVEMAHRKYASFYSVKHPRWHSRLIMRSLLDPSPSLITVVEQLFRPDHADMRRLLKKARPDLDEQNAEVIALSMMGQLAFYEFARAPLLHLMGKEDYDAGFIDAAARYTALMIIVALGLPIPASCASEYAHS